MLIFSLNISGLGKSPNHTVVRCLIKSSNHDIVLIYETMAQGNQAINYFGKILPVWSYFIVDIDGKYADLMLSWNDVFEVSKSQFCLRYYPGMFL
jgi:hypothetical protein